MKIRIELVRGTTLDVAYTDSVNSCRAICQAAIESSIYDNAFAYIIDDDGRARRL